MQLHRKKKLKKPSKVKSAVIDSIFFAFHSSQFGCLQDGNMEGARIYGQNAIREKNQALNFLRLCSRIDAVASRLETAIRMQQINSAMSQTVKGMTNAMKSMEVEKIGDCSCLRTAVQDIYIPAIFCCE